MFSFVFDSNDTTMNPQPEQQIKSSSNRPLPTDRTMHVDPEYGYFEPKVSYLAGIGTISVIYSETFFMSRLVCTVPGILFQ